jgi:hypothetical protein
MFWLWVLGRGLVHMLSELMRAPRLDDAVIAVLVLDSVLVQNDLQENLNTSEAAGSGNRFVLFRHRHCHPSIAQVKLRTPNPKLLQSHNARKLTQKVVSLMILRPPRNLNTLQAIIDSALPALQLQPSIRAIREKQRVAGKSLASLRVEFFGGCVVALFERLVALLFESVGGCLGHR